MGEEAAEDNLAVPKIFEQDEYRFFFYSNDIGPFMFMFAMGAGKPSLL